MVAAADARTHYPKPRRATRIASWIEVKRKGRIVVLHLAIRYPFAGVVWQLLHHLIGLRALGLEVYYIEDHGAYVYDAIAQTSDPDSPNNLKLVGGVLDRFGFAGRWGFLDPITHDYVGMAKDKCLKLIRESDAVINLCGASEPREEHLASPMMIYLETDPGVFQVNIERGDPIAMLNASAHKLFFTYAYNIGQPDCRVPSARLDLASDAASGAARRMASGSRACESTRIYYRRNVAQQGQRHRGRRHDLLLVEARELRESSRRRAARRSADRARDRSQLRTRL